MYGLEDGSKSQFKLTPGSQITGVDMHRTDLDSDVLAEFPLVEGQHVLMQN